MGYYDRAGGLATDGTPTFATRQDAESEREVAALLSQRWSCEFHPFGALAAIDWWLIPPRPKGTGIPVSPRPAYADLRQKTYTLSAG